MGWSDGFYEPRNAVSIFLDGRRPQVSHDKVTFTCRAQEFDQFMEIVDDRIFGGNNHYAETVLPQLEAAAAEKQAAEQRQAQAQAAADASARRWAVEG